MNNYVQCLKEISGVSKVRKEYISKYIKLLIRWGRLNKDSVLIDVPCGAGEMTKAIAAKNIGRKFYLIDLNPIMIRVARKQAIRNSVLIMGDAGDIGKLVPEKVDGIFCLNGFHIYIDRKQEFLKGCYKTLKPNGTFIFDISSKGMHDKSSKIFLNIEAKEMKILAENSGAQYRALKLPDEKLVGEYRNRVTKVGFCVHKTIIFNTRVHVDQLINETVLIPGRLRPRLLGITDNQRIKIYRQANQIAKKKTGIKMIKHSRIFFIAKKGR